MILILTAGFKMILYEVFAYFLCAVYRPTYFFIKFLTFFFFLITGHPRQFNSSIARGPYPQQPGNNTSIYFRTSRFNLTTSQVFPHLQQALECYYVYLFPIIVFFYFFSKNLFMEVPQNVCHFISFKCSRALLHN